MFSKNWHIKNLEEGLMLFQKPRKSDPGLGIVFPNREAPEGYTPVFDRFRSHKNRMKLSKPSHSSDTKYNPGHRPAGCYSLFSSYYCNYLHD